jgi:hypothetical protein
VIQPKKNKKIKKSKDLTQAHTHTHSTHKDLLVLLFIELQLPGGLCGWREFECVRAKRNHKDLRRIQPQLHHLREQRRFRLEPSTELPPVLTKNGIPGGMGVRAGRFHEPQSVDCELERVCTVDLGAGVGTPVPFVLVQEGIELIVERKVVTHHVGNGVHDFFELTLPGIILGLLLCVFFA